MLSQEKTKILKDFYKKSRDETNDIENTINSLTHFIDNNIEENERLYLSFISLKNDLILQYDLNKKNIFLYKQDLAKCFDNKLYLLNWETPFKFFEIIAKIQYANNLLYIVDEDLYNFYNMFLKFYYSNLFDYVKELIDKPISYDKNQFAFIHNVSFLFIPFYDAKFNPEYAKETLFDYSEKNLLNPMDELCRNDLYRNILLSLLYRMKEHKMKHYDMKLSDIEDEGFFGYKFIYKG